MKPSMTQKLEQQAQRLEDVNRLLSGDQLLKDPKALRQYHREHAELSQLMEHFHAWGVDKAVRAASPIPVDFGIG
ncbi:MAG: hypothetical protein EBX62_11205, partial [Betaproteobacteria bacterium]|nr:hypothetical protein [Betaproteobacteria bacterium]